jgi:hypothetical protein
MVVLMAVIALVVGVAGTAQAAARATHYQVSFLSAAPNSSMPVSCQPARELVIIGDTYEWGQYFGGIENVLNPALVLRTDTYIWGDCLYPQNGHYWHVSSLQAKNHPEWPTAYIESPEFMFGGDDRLVTWGSFLDR